MVMQYLYRNHTSMCRTGHDFEREKEHTSCEGRRGSGKNALFMKLTKNSFKSQVKSKNQILIAQSVSSIRETVGISHATLSTASI